MCHQVGPQNSRDVAFKLNPGPLSHNRAHGVFSKRKTQEVTHVWEPKSVGIGANEVCVERYDNGMGRFFGEGILESHYSS